MIHLFYGYDVNWT